jgi:hypothetical protein
VYNAVTLGDEDVEWIRPYEDVKDAIWDDADFARYVDGTGVADALYEVSWLHRQVANQLIVRAVKDPKVSVWAGRTIFLCKRLKRRRHQLWAMYRGVYGPDALTGWVARFEERFPRAMWGSMSEKEARRG